MNVDSANSRARNWLHRNALAMILCVVYALMTGIVVEQSHTIDSQRALIHQLFHDSLELHMVKVQKQAEKRTADR